MSNLTLSNSSSTCQYPPPPDSLLCLLKFHPFPLPFTNTHSLLLDMDNYLYSLSRLHAEISPASLTDCQKLPPSTSVNKKASCTGNSTPCVWVPYTTRTPLCPFSFISHKELVLQVQAPLYLVFMPAAQTILIQCLSSTNDECFIPEGFHSITVPLSCKATLPVTSSSLTYPTGLNLNSKITSGHKTKFCC